MIKNPKTYYQVIQNALEIMANREKYAYWYGAKNQVLTRELMDALVVCEPEHFARYAATRLQNLKQWSLGKVGLDCSGFINAITGMTNYSTGYYTDTLNKTSPEKGTEGNILYTTWGGKGRHVGLDIGYGYALEFAREGESCIITKISERGWEHSGQIRGIDYTGAKA